ncbi:MAG TPA: hypothetical protein VFY48_04270 [Solirubrobacterales bacterium]|nr:hypothetical protein [Solirubrobacterales bacterium]
MEESSTDQRFREMDKRFDRLEAATAASTAELRREIKQSVAELRKENQESNAGLRKEIQRATAELRREIKDSNAELRIEFLATNERVDTLQRTLLQIGGGMIGTMIVVFGGLAATQI